MITLNAHRNLIWATHTKYLNLGYCKNNIKLEMKLYFFFHALCCYFANTLAFEHTKRIGSWSSSAKWKRHRTLIITSAFLLPSLRFNKMCSNNQWLTIKYTLIHALKMLLHTDQQRMLTKKTNVERLRQMSIRFASVRKQQIMKVTAQEYIYIYIQESFIVPCTWILVWYWVFTLKQIERSTWIGGKKESQTWNGRVFA